VKTGKFFHTYIKTRKQVSPGAFNVHGISNEFLEDKPTFSEIAKDFISFVKDTKLIIHNARFDMGFLNNELHLAGLPRISMNYIIDTLLLARKKYPGSPANLDALCKKFNISLDTRDKHGALIDAELLAMVYINLVDKKQKNIKFEKEMDLNPSEISIKVENRNFKISDKEEAEHEALINDMKNPLWKKCK
jgi:DNA polymerase-3 subunit epsilon